MSRRITAENIKLKRAYDSAGSATALEYCIDRLWPAASGKQMLRLICGPRILHPAPRCDGGSDMILPVVRVSTPLLGRDTSASWPARRTTYPRSGRTNYARFCSA